MGVVGEMFLTLMVVDAGVPERGTKQAHGPAQRWSFLAHKHQPKSRPIDGEVPVATRAARLGAAYCKQNKELYSH